MCELQHLQNVARDAGCGVDDDEIEGQARLFDRRVQPIALQRSQRRQRLNARRGRQDTEAARPIDEDVLEPFRARQEMADMRIRRQAEHDVDVAEREIAVDDGYAVAEPGQRDRDVDCQAGLADAALAAGDREHHRSLR